MASQQLIDIIIKAQDQASATAEKVNQSLNKIGSTVGGFINKVPGLSGISAKLGNIGSTIRGKLEGPLTSARQKLENLSNGAKGFGAALGPLKSALSMTVGMIGYDLVNGLVAAARASINANSQLDYFGQRLNMTAAESAKFRSELDGLQKEFRKVDMTAVGATAEEMAVKFKLPKDSISDLTRMTAVLSSTFVKEGRSQEDAILAVGDALDGQFKRLQEIGITQETLKANGWNGNIEDQKSLIDALNKSMQEMGYEQTAKDITNLDEAWTALTIAGGQLLQKILVPITPLIIQMVDAFLKVADTVSPIIEGFASLVSNMPDWAKIALLLGGLAVAVQLVSTWITATLVPALAAAALAALDFAAAMLANPLTWIVVALAAVAVAIYEIGKAFGWWTDVNSMLSAIWAGIQRLWSAFINHPDVQGFLTLMGQAWRALAPAIQSVVSWVMSFFNNSSQSKFDVVRTFINAVGVAWNAMTLPIRLVITAVRLAITTFTTWYNRARTTINNIRALFAALPGRIRSAISSLVNIITAPFRNAYSGVTSAVNRIKSYVQGLTNINLSGITNAIVKPFTDAYNRVVNEVNKIKAKASELSGGLIALGGEDLVAYGGEGMNVNMKQDINLTLDLKNVPQNIDEATLHAVVVDTLTDKGVISLLVNNDDFQTMDNRVKSRMLARQNRARGV